LAAASAFVCTIHYFGVLSWVGALLVAVWFADGPRRRTVVRLLPALAGPFALALCVPFYVGQRAALSTTTWIPDLSVVGAIFLISLALLTPPAMVAVLGWVASRFLQRRSATSAVSPPVRGFTLGPALFLGQALVPVALAIFSLAVQPAMQPRYSIAAALVAAPIVALAYARSLPVFRAVTLVLVVVAGATLVVDARTAARKRADVVRQDIAQVTRIVALDSTIVTRRRHSLYPIVIARPAVASHVLLFDGASVLPNDKFEAVERDVARVHLRFYGFPRIVSPAELDSARAFYFLEQDSTRVPTPAEFPDRHIERVGPRLFRLETMSRNGSSVLYPMAAGPLAERVVQ
jgi:hypothetical protein